MAGWSPGVGTKDQARKQCPHGYAGRTDQRAHARARLDLGDARPPTQIEEPTMSSEAASNTNRSADILPAWMSVLAVVAHPDDESFGLGAILDAFTRTGARVEVLCLTHGEACLLYTSPSPRDRTRSRMPSSA